MNLRPMSEQPTKEGYIIIDCQGPNNELIRLPIDVDHAQGQMYIDHKGGEDVHSWEDLINYMKFGDCTPTGWRYLDEKVKVKWVDTVNGMRSDIGFIRLTVEGDMNPPCAGKDAAAFPVRWKVLVIPPKNWLQVNPVTLASGNEGTRAVAQTAAINRYNDIFAMLPKEVM